MVCYRWIDRLHAIKYIIMCLTCIHFHHQPDNLATKPEQQDIPLFPPLHIPKTPHSILPNTPTSYTPNPSSSLYSQRDELCMAVSMRRRTGRGMMLSMPLMHLRYLSPINKQPITSPPSITSILKRYIPHHHYAPPFSRRGQG